MQFSEKRIAKLLYGTFSLNDSISVEEFMDTVCSSQASLVPRSFAYDTAAKHFNLPCALVRKAVRSLQRGDFVSLK